MLSPADFQTLERLGQNLTSLQIDVALLGLQIAAKAGFNPNQPRVPAGNPEGGQWARFGGALSSHPNTDPTHTAGQSDDTANTESRRTIVRDESGRESWEAVVTSRRRDGTISEQNVLNRDGTAIRSEFASVSGGSDFDERHTVVATDGTTLTFENVGYNQRITDGFGDLLAEASWRPSGPKTEVFRPDLLGPNNVDGVATLLPLGLVLYNWLTSVAEPDRRPVLSFSAREYLLGAGQTFALDSVRTLDQQEVDGACPRYGEVQARTDEAVATVRRRGALDLSPQAFGTAVHVELKKKIDGFHDPNLVAEISLLKSSNAAGFVPMQEPDPVRYGRLGSIRIDVLEHVNNGIVCVYDVKTGASGLRTTRAAEIAQTVVLRYPDTDRIIVIEVRPTR